MAAAVHPAGSLSARGVAGEARNSPLRELLRKHGGEVPHYNEEGQQHYRVPFKDKSHYADVREKAEWLQQPRHRTRTELLAARRAAKCPDISYDVDGDGAVGPTDYFVGKTFGRQQDHRLNTGERDQVVQALENGWLDKYSFGHEQAGAKRSMAVRQFRGKVVTADSAAELTEVYPPHWNADKVPKHPTTTDLNMHRTAELRQSADKLRDQWDAKNPRNLPQPPVIQEFSVADPPMTHIWQRSEAFKSTAREEKGMDPVTSTVNPARETQEVGLGWRDAPEFATRTALQEARRVRLQEDATVARAMGEQVHVPVPVARTIRNHEDYEGRRADPEAMTLTKLSARRKQERIEHNMANFTQIPPEPPRFSDQDKSWWTMRNGYCPEPPTSVLKEMRDIPEAVASKVTEVRPPRPRGARVGPEKPPQASQEFAGFPTGGPIGQKARARWSDEFVTLNNEMTEKRYFDGVGLRQAPVLATDTLPLYHFSSFEVIRRNGAREDAERQRQQAEEDMKQAIEWSAHVKNGSSKPPTAEQVAENKVDSATTWPSEIGSQRRASRPQVPRLPLGPITRRLEEPLGQDLPMTERLEMITCSRSARHEGETPKAANARSSSHMTTGRGHDSPTLKAPDRAPSIAGSAAAPTPGPGPRQTQMVVRSGGFQWLDRHRTGQRLEEPSIAPSLRRTPQDTSLPPSLRRTPQNSVRNLGTDSVISRTQSRNQDPTPG